MVQYKNQNYETQEDIYRKISNAMNSNEPGSLPFKDYTDMWLLAYKAPPKTRESSYSTLSNSVKTNVVPFFDGMSLSAVTPMHIQMYLNSISHLSAGMQRKCFQCVKSIFNTAVDNKLLEKSPVPITAKIVGAEKKLHEEPLSNEQAKALLDSLVGTRAYLFVLIALSTGMRRGEILGLMWDDIDFNRRVINVTHNCAFISGKNEPVVSTLLKTESSRRTLPMSDKLVKELLKEKERSESRFVIHKKDNGNLTLSSFASLWGIVESRVITDEHEEGARIGGKSAKGATYCLDFRCHPHQLRHTFCTQCIEAGMEIKEVQHLMGHATPDITMKIYTHYREKSRENETAERVRNVVNYL